MLFTVETLCAVCYADAIEKGVIYVHTCIELRFVFFKISGF